MNEQTNKQTNKWMKKKHLIKMNEWMESNEWIFDKKKEWMNENWMNEWMNIG